MKINIKLWCDFYRIEDKYKILLILSALYEQNKISEEKFKGQIASLRKGDLLKFKHSHHSNINNKWYNDETAIEVYKDYLSLINPIIDSKTVLKYISLLLNVNYNFSINVFLTEYIKPIFTQWNPEYDTENFSKYIDLDWSLNLIAKKTERYCYNCGISSNSYSKNKDKNLELISDYFHKLKKGNLKLIPKLELS